MTPTMCAQNSFFLHTVMIAGCWQMLAHITQQPVRTLQVHLLQGASPICLLSVIHMVVVDMSF